jgi:transposase
MLTRWQAFTRFLDDGRVCMSTAERALRGLATGLSLCTSFSSVWKHWKWLRGFGATRARFPADGRGDGLRMQVA